MLAIAVAGGLTWYVATRQPRIRVGTIIELYGTQYEITHLPDPSRTNHPDDYLATNLRDGTPTYITVEQMADAIIISQP